MTTVYSVYLNLESKSLRNMDPIYDSPLQNLMMSKRMLVTEMMLNRGALA